MIVTGNLFGDILSDLGAQLVGGLGLAGLRQHPPRAGVALFEPVHGSAPDLAGQGVANPFAALLTSGLLLRHLGHRERGGAHGAGGRRGDPPRRDHPRPGRQPLHRPGAGDAVCRLLDG